MKKTALTFIASRIPEDQIEDLRESFIKIDINGDGQITLEELKKGFNYLFGADHFNETEVEEIMFAMDLNKNGMLDYTEFIAGCM